MNRYGRPNRLRFWTATLAAMAGATGCAADQTDDVGSGGKTTAGIIAGTEGGERMKRSADATVLVANPSNATPCVKPSDCATGFCVDGVCCNSACSGVCQACTVAKKGNGADGTCGNIGNGLDPDNECLGVCNGFGACSKGSVLLGLGADCSLGTECSSGYCVDGVCCNANCAGLCLACTLAMKGSGADGTCGYIAPNTDPENECVAGQCDGSGACGAPPGMSPNGTACGSGSTCLSGYCTDGVCCNSACGATCQACSTAKKGGGANGICGNIAAGTDPDNECLLGNCGGSGSCSASFGAGNGASCASGGDCASGFCVDGVCCDTACSGTCAACTAAKKGNGSDGQCGNIASATDPDNECASTCNGSGACSSVLATNGTPCTNGGSCESGFCVESVCCDWNCQGQCMSCLATHKGSGVDGTCGPIALGADPYYECYETCDGFGACISRGYANGSICGDDTDCASGYCVEDYCCDTPCTGLCKTCTVYGTSGTNGICSDVIAGYDPRDSCTYACNSAGTCGSSPGISPLGAACTANSDCSSGWCVDNVCCNAACGSTCDACNVPGSIGTCTATCSGGCTGTTGLPGSPLPPVIPAGSTSVWGVAVGDFNGDERQDLFVDNWIFHQQSDGSFKPYSPGGATSLRALALGDFNGDTRVDLVNAYAGAGGVAVTLGSEHGTFSYITNYATGQVGSVTTPQPDMVRIADINGDAKLDIISANTLAGTVSMVLGQGNGAFLSKVDLPMPTNPTAIAIADVNADGKADLAVATYDAATTNYRVSVRMGLGGTTFGAAVHYPVGKNSRSLASADFNGDGRPDLVSGSDDTVTGYKLHVLLNLGNGTFSNATVYDVSGVARVLPADVNGDSIVDLVVAGYASRLVDVLLGQGNGTFSAAAHYMTASLAAGLAVTDMDADGDNDIVLGSDKGVTILRNSGAGTFGGTIAPTIPLDGRILRNADLNTDGHLDLVSIGDTGIHVAPGQGNGTFGAGIFSPSVSQGTAMDASLGDLNGDGKTDVIFQRSGAGMGVQLGLGNGSFGPETSYAMGINPDRLLLNDFNGDGILDVVTSDTWIDTPMVGSYKLLSVALTRRLGLGNGTFGAISTQNLAQFQVYYSGGGNTPIASGDFDNDGRMDVVMNQFEWHGGYIYRNPGNAIFTQSTFVGPHASGITFRAPDLNGDGKADYVYRVYYPAGGVDNLSIAFFNGTGAGGTFSVPRVSEFAFADLNGDGLKEVITVGKDAPIVTVLPQGPNGTFGPRMDYAGVGSSPESLTAGDWNNDGKIDLAVLDVTAKKAAILLNSCLP